MIITEYLLHVTFILSLFLILFLRVRVLFVDNNNTLHYYLSDSHQVVQVLLETNIITPKIRAETGFAGSTSDTLDSSRGIYVYFGLNFVCRRLWE